MSETHNISALVRRIRFWQDDDKGGYDQAIELVCEAADALERLSVERLAATQALREQLAQEQRARSAAETHAREASLEERGLRQQLAEITQERNDLGQLLDESTKALECRALAAETALTAQREDLEVFRDRVKDSWSALGFDASTAPEWMVREAASIVREALDEALTACTPTKSAG